MGSLARLLPCGTRLHLQHGPIDLVIGADGDRNSAFAAADARFQTILSELVDELPILKEAITDNTSPPKGVVALRMDKATQPFCDRFVTRMAAVAGAVADEVLKAMLQSAKLRRAYVNNGGDIALHLGAGEKFHTIISDVTGTTLGTINLGADDAIKGIATSGRFGRSLSFGIADSVTVLAYNAAAADAAATLVANDCNLPGHPAIQRQKASDLDPNSDLGAHPVVTNCAPLSTKDIETALSSGAKSAQRMAARGLIHSAVLFLQGQQAMIGQTQYLHPERTCLYA